MDHAKQKEELLEWVERDRDLIIGFLQEFIRRPSPNPPGDTRDAAQHVINVLKARALDYRTVAPEETMPNIVASFDGADEGRHLVLNGHMDVFPVGDESAWSVDPWGGNRIDGRIYGRGACDMKSGTTASIFTYAYLHQIKERLKGRLTLTVVSDEETFGPWGSRYLIENHPEVRGDCLLNAEPSTPLTVRFGEKGPFWLALTVTTPGGHGAYTHMSESATKTAAKLVNELEQLTELEPALPENIRQAVEEGAEAMDKALGDGASKIVPRVTVNIGRIDGGVKINMLPGKCRIELDVRVPVGMEPDQVRGGIDRIVGKYPNVTVEVLNYNAPAHSDPYDEMIGTIRANAEGLSGTNPAPVISVGGTDARLWRYKGIPAYVYGPYPNGMGGVDEYVDEEEFLHVLRTHLLSAYDYATA